jgi:hypothetical protein
MRNTETLLQLLVRIVLRWIGDKIQDGAKAFLGHSIDDKVEPVLLVVHPLQAKTGSVMANQASVFSAQKVGRWKEESPLLGCSLFIVGRSPM